MGTDDGFIVETRDGSGVTRWLVLALDETEALDLLRTDMPEGEHTVTASGDDLRAQAARLGIEPGTYRRMSA